MSQRIELGFTNFNIISIGTYYNISLLVKTKNIYSRVFTSLIYLLIKIL